ncbi:hypothetical protein NLI96_g12353 [Meripilus lineatus]|uniref:Uncharacterized protein n=1 Tax=Meripilus lineatus TaxID=2056292 RepID=A0AAD5Y7N7_9APHY|nr:hypothetical protein NLI96_g12353 [Physisporinus lineatus]
MKQEFKSDDIPEWDGEGSTAIAWFAACQEFASNGGYLPEQMGYWMGYRIKDGTAARNWFTTLPLDIKTRMRSHYLDFLEGVKEGFLGDTWLHDRRMEYKHQEFRQYGHRYESPIDFIQRRLTFARVLMHVPINSDLEVHEVLQNAPVAWSTILVAQTIANTVELQLRTRRYEAQLLEAHRMSRSTVLTRENAMPILRELIQSAKSERRDPQKPRPFTRDRRANVVTKDTDEVEKELVEAFISTTLEDSESHSEDIGRITQLEIDEHAAVREVYAATTGSRRQRKPPIGGYPYPKKDEVKSILRPPPSPCKCCGSGNHWDKECPWYGVWERKYGRRTAQLVSADGRSEEDDVYNEAYEALIIQSSFSTYRVQTPAHKGFLKHDELVQLGLAETDEESHKAQHRPGYGLVNASVVEVPDEEDEVAPKDSALHFIIEEIRRREAMNLELSTNDVPTEAEPKETETTRHATTSPPVHRLKPKRKFKDGHLAVGQSVVAMRGKLGAQREAETDLRLDSCADVSLLSEEFYRSMKAPPKLHQGLRMKLYQLTDKDTKLSGFVKIPVFVESMNGELLEMEAEAYVVPGMTVPVLLGEDFHNTYELSVSRSVDFGTSVHFGGTEFSAKATGVRRTGDYHRLRKSAETVHASYVRAKTHRRNKARRRRKKRAEETDRATVKAAEDVRIPAHTSKLVRLTGHFEEKKEWMLERTFLTTSRNTNIVHS